MKKNRKGKLFKKKLNKQKRKLNGKNKEKNN